MRQQPFDASVYGLGYIGIPTLAVLAEFGLRVCGIDIVETKVLELNAGQLTYPEETIQVLINEAHTKGLISASTDPQISDIHIIVVPTPLKFNDLNSPKPDTSAVVNAAKSISSVLRKGDLIIVESTCPVGTTQYIKSLIIDLTGFSASDFDVVYCPERVLPGNIYEELRHNNRIIGGEITHYLELARNLYGLFCDGEIHITTARTAEMVKLVENSYRDVNIAFANEVSMLADSLKCDHKLVIQLANMHPRVNILKAGCGVGGHCIAVDPYFLISADLDNTHLINAARSVNSKKPLWVASQIINFVESQELSLSNISICCLGLSYKPNVDDYRESPAIQIVKILSQSHLHVLIHDPFCEPSVPGCQLLDKNTNLYSIKYKFILVGHDIYLSDSKLMSSVSAVFSE